MRALAALLIPLGLAVVPDAQARPWPVVVRHQQLVTQPAGVIVDNDAGLAVRVYIDGRYRGDLAPGAVRTFSTTPGRAQVVVKGGRRDLVLAQHSALLRHGQRASMRVVPPRTTLAVVNHGDTPLFVSVSDCGSAGFWMLPGARERVDVRPGWTTVTTSVSGLRGLVPVDTTQVHVHPGEHELTQVAWTPVRGFHGTTPHAQPGHPGRGHGPPHKRGRDAHDHGGRYLASR